MERFDNTLVKLARSRLLDSFSAEGQPLTPTFGNECIAAGLGFWTYKHLSEYRTPLTLKPVGVHAEPTNPEYLELVAKRFERFLKLNAPQAQWFAPRVISVIKLSGLAVDTARCLFDPELQDVQEKILAAMDDKCIETPKRASAAIHRKLVSRPLQSGLQEWLKELAPQLSLLCVKHAEIFVWQHTCTTDEAFVQATRDEYSYRGYVHRAELGLGISLILHNLDYRGRDLFTIATPLMILAEDGHWRLRLDELHWSGSYRGGKVGLEAAIGRTLADLPTLVACPDCHEVTVRRLLVLNHACKPVVSTEALGKAVKKLQEENLEYVTTRELIVAYEAEGGSPPDPAEFVQFLLRFKRTFSLRESNGRWRFPEKFGEKPRPRLVVPGVDDRDPILVSQGTAPAIYISRRL
jgi:hypothetical protein